MFGVALKTEVDDPLFDVERDRRCTCHAFSIVREDAPVEHSDVFDCYLSVQSQTDSFNLHEWQ